MVGLWEGVPASPCSGASDDGATRPRITRYSQRTRSGKRSRFASHPRRSDSPDSSAVEFVGASRKANGKDAELVAKLNINAADERRKMLLAQLRVIDRRKAMLQNLANNNGSTSAGSSRETIAGVIEAATPEPFDGEPVDQSSASVKKEQVSRTKPNLVLDVSMARSIGSYSAVDRFCSSPTPTATAVYGSPLPSPSPGSSGSFSYADLPTRRSSRRATRPRTPSVLLNGMPGETVLRKLPVGVLKCKRYGFCKKVISILIKSPSANPFSAPVKELWKPEAIPRYFDVITRPMDLGTVKKNMEGITYLNMEESNPLLMFRPEQFADDVRQVFRNAMIYNREGDVLHNCAGDLLHDFENMWKELPDLPQPGDRQRKRPAPTANGSSKRSRIGDGPSPTHLRQGGKGLAKAKKSPKSPTQAPLEVTEFKVGLSTRQYRRRLDYLRKCRIALRSRTFLPKGASFYDRGALLHDVPMTDSEKNEIAKAVNRLPYPKLQQFLDIIGHSDEEEEFELDINSFDTKMLRNIEAFMEATLSNFKTIRNSSIGEEFSSVEQFQDEMKQIEKHLSENTKQPRSNRKPSESTEPTPAVAANASGKDLEELYASSDSDSGDSDSDGESDGSGSDSD